MSRKKDGFGSWISHSEMVNSQTKSTRHQNGTKERELVLMVTMVPMGRIFNSLNIFVCRKHPLTSLNLLNWLFHCVNPPLFDAIPSITLIVGLLHHKDPVCKKAPNAIGTLAPSIQCVSISMQFSEHFEMEFWRVPKQLGNTRVCVCVCFTPFGVH
jgi:hypothetical protein